MTRLFIILLCGFVLGGGIPSAQAEQGEHLIVSGGVTMMQWEKYKAEPHDKWWLNFIRAARIRIEELRAEYGPHTPITWFVYRPAYVRRVKEEPKDMFGIIESIPRAFGNVRLVYFSQTAELIRYMNYGQPRDHYKILTFDYFGHSNRACFMFDYSNEIDSASKVYLHEDELSQIRKGIFARRAEVVSWGCHTGESMSGKWRSATGIPMRGAIGKTYYQTHTLPIISTAGGRWAE